MKNPLAFLALLPSLLFAAVWDGTADTTWYTKNKDATEYIIRTAEELAGLARLVRGEGGSGTYDMSGKTIKLGNDIALNDTANWRNWATNNAELRQWTPIGTYNYGYNDKPFNGTFDGNGYAVSGVYINVSSDCQGLFGYVGSGATIKNLGMVASYIKGNTYTGGLVGLNNGTISNSYATGNVGSRGGLVGQNKGTISCSYANVSGTGALVEFNERDSNISNSYAIGNSLARQNAGTISYSYTTSGSLVENNWGNIINSFSLSQNMSQDEKKTMITKNNWDLNKIWGIWSNINNGMPYLFWQYPIMLMEIESISDQEYTGSQITLEPNVYLNGTLLIKDTDFEYIYGTNLNVGTGSVTIVDKVYFEEKTVTFKIVKNTTLTPPFPEIAPRTAKLSINLTLASITVTPTLPSNCEWVNPETQITKAGEQKFNVECSNPNYDKTVIELVSVNVDKGDGIGTVSIATWVYGEAPKTPSTSSSTHPDDTPVFNYTGTDYGPSPAQPTDAGDYAVTATFPENENYNAFTTPALDFTITKAQGTGSVSMANWYSAEAAPPPAPVSSTNGTEGVTYRYWSTDGQTYLPSPSVPSNPGLYIIEATFPANLNYNSFKTTANFEIFENTNVNVVNVTWDLDCGAKATLTYNGTEQSPVPSAKDYVLTVTGGQTNAGSHAATAKLAEQSTDVSLQNNVCPYTILPKPLAVTWTPEREFTYNKMTQGPTPSVSEPGVVLRVSNTYSGVGEYTAANKRAPYAVIISANANNYELQNNSVDYSILPRPLKPYFTPILPPTDFKPSTEALWVPYEVFKDSAALLTALSTLIDYDGFATDTLSKESDNAAVLRGTPKITLQYTEASTLKRAYGLLPKRVETTQKATATIATDDVSADNYALTRPAIVILATIEEDETAAKVYCQLGNNCSMFSEAVCSAISGEIVQKCDIKVACVINSVCVENTPVENCTAMNGEAFSSCYLAPVLRPAFSAGTFRVWQTASGVVNVDLGYMPSAPVKLQIYDLKGKVVATEQVNTRFANVRIEAVSGVYLFRVGDKVLKAMVL